MTTTSATTAYTSGGFTSAEKLTRELRAMLESSAIDMAQSKVSRVVRGFLSQPRAESFFDYVSQRMQLTVTQQHRFAGRLAKVLDYADPTGELAIWRVAFDADHPDWRAQQRAGR